MQVGAFFCLKFVYLNSGAGLVIRCALRIGSGWWYRLLRLRNIGTFNGKNSNLIIRGKTMDSASSNLFSFPELFYFPNNLLCSHNTFSHT